LDREDFVSRTVAGKKPFIFLHGDFHSPHIDLFETENSFFIVRLMETVPSPPVKIQLDPDFSVGVPTGHRAMKNVARIDAPLFDFLNSARHGMPIPPDTVKQALLIIQFSFHAAVRVPVMRGSVQDPAAVMFFGF
jgi:hypothetical protein